MKYKLRLILLAFICCFTILQASQATQVPADFPKIDSPAAILIHPDSGKIIYEKNAYEKMYPASTTKIMTAILVLESGLPLTETAVVSNNAISLVPPGHSHANLQEGEKFTLEQLLDVLLISSANDAANVLAEKIAGSISVFADKMNEKAQSLGCLNTHFINPSGIHNSNHYSSAYDLSFIASYAMKNATFREFVCKTSCSLPATEQYPSEDRIFNTTNNLLLDGPYHYSYATGIKTGFTSQAQNCLVASSTKNDISLISVVLGSIQTDDGFSQRYSDTIKLLEYANTHYIMRNIKNEKDTVSITALPNSNNELSLLAQTPITALTHIDSVDNIVPQITLNSNLHLPIYEGDIVGKASYLIDGTIYDCNLIAGNNIEVDSIGPFVIKITMFIILLLLIYFLLFPPKKKNIFEKKSFKITQI